LRQAGDNHERRYDPERIRRQHKQQRRSDCGVDHRALQRAMLAPTPSSEPPDRNTGEARDEVDRKQRL
jgi:hypothetical protein